MAAVEPPRHRHKRPPLAGCTTARSRASEPDHHICRIQGRLTDTVRLCTDDHQHVSGQIDLMEVVVADVLDRQDSISCLLRCSDGLLDAGLEHWDEACGLHAAVPDVFPHPTGDGFIGGQNHSSRTGHFGRAYREANVSGVGHTVEAQHGPSAGKHALQVFCRWFSSNQGQDLGQGIFSRVGHAPKIPRRDLVHRNPLLSRNVEQGLQIG
ncbi:MAG: hypothetical protein VXY39_03280 [Candidatus Thermoplasmatota archaeon]|nr:hypothetical protein [Candidatus Thermoplasmatota archaeon]